MQFFGTEKITKLATFSTTQVQLPAGTLVKAKGVGLSNSATLFCSTATTGAGGLDTGIVANSTLYYVYIVLSGSTSALVASTSAVSPTGFTVYRKIGAFYTGTTALITGTTYFEQFADVQNVRYSNFSATAPTADSAICHFTTLDITQGSGIFSVATDATNGTRITILKKCKVVAQWNGAFVNAQDCGFSSNSNQLSTALNAITVAHRKSLSRFAANEPTQANMEAVFVPGDVIRPHNGNSGSRSGTPTDFFLDFTAVEFPLDWTIS